MRSADVLAVLDAAYQVEAAPAAWLSGVLGALGPHLDSGAGVCGYFVDLSDPGTIRTSGYQGQGAMLESAARFEKWAREVPVSFQRHTHLFGPCGYASDIPRLGNVAIEEVTLPAHGIPDMLGVNALDATGRGCAFAAAHMQALGRKLGKGRYAVFRRIASHIAAGARIAQNLRATKADADAVISPSGKIAHATGAAREAVARKALANAAVQIDRARTRHGRLAPEEVTELWKGLVAERWSLIDQFDRDGRRYFIAHANAPRMPDHAVLSEREAQVVGAAAMGHATKLIAYELGISASSVSTHLARAARKLGVRSRVELVRAFSERGFRR